MAQVNAISRMLDEAGFAQWNIPVKYPPENRTDGNTRYIRVVHSHLTILGEFK